MWKDEINNLLTLYMSIWFLVIMAFFLLRRKTVVKPNKNKYRVGKKQGRAILEVETGREYLVLPSGKEDLAKHFCDWLNTSAYRETETKRLILKLLEERLENAKKEKNNAKIKEHEIYWMGIEVEVNGLIRIIQKDEHEA